MEGWVERVYGDPESRRRHMEITKVTLLQRQVQGVVQGLLPRGKQCFPLPRLGASPSRLDSLA